MQGFRVIDEFMGRTYVVARSRAKMPNSCWGTYDHSAVLRINGTWADAPGCIRNTRTTTIVRDSGVGYVGTTSRCKAEKDEDRMIDYAKELAASWRANCCTKMAAGYVESLAERSGEEL